MLRSSSPRLPVPAAWQAPVLAAMAHLVDRLGVVPAAVAATRVEEGAWTAPGGETVGGLEIWLMAGGATYRYRAAGPDMVPEPAVTTGTP